MNAGLLETIRARRGRVPFLDRHLARLRDALAARGAAGPAPDLAARLLVHAAAGELVVRVVVDETGEHVTTRTVPDRALADAVIASVPHERYPHKSVARVAFDRAAGEAAARGAGEAILLTPDGWVAEGSISTLFFWRGDALCTPALELGILPGVGRARVLEVAGAAHLAVEQGRYGVPVLRDAPGFLVNAVRGISELASLDGRPLPSDPRTARLAAAFWP